VSQITESFDEISYQKGSCVLRMMHLFLGEDAFRSGLWYYEEIVFQLLSPDKKHVSIFLATFGASYYEEWPEWVQSLR